MQVDIELFFFFFHKNLHLFVFYIRNVLASRPVPYLSAKSAW